MMAAGGRSAAGPGEWGALAPCFGALLCRYRCRRCLMRQALAFCFIRSFASCAHKLMNKCTFSLRTVCVTRREL